MDCTTAEMPRSSSARALGVLKTTLSNFRYFFSTGAPLGVYVAYIRALLARPRRQQHQRAFQNYLAERAQLKTSNDWFSANTLYWLDVFAEFRLAEKPLQALEIGSWEGLSSNFLLKNLPLAHLTCVDTWAGSDEHLGKDVLNSIEAHFDSNLAPYAARLTKFKGTSYAFFGQCPAAQRFDFIYIDGSHHADDVMMDGLKSFQHLNIGGLMIFDDYLWKFYEKRALNPASAIHAFLKLKMGCYRIIAAYGQLVIQKTAHSVM